MFKLFDPNDHGDAALLIDCTFSCDVIKGDTLDSWLGRARVIEIAAARVDGELVMHAALSRPSIGALHCSSRVLREVLPRLPPESGDRSFSTSAELAEQLAGCVERLEGRPAIATRFMGNLVALARLCPRIQERADLTLLPSDVGPARPPRNYSAADTALDLAQRVREQAAQRLVMTHTPSM